MRAATGVLLAWTLSPAGADAGDALGFNLRQSFIRDDNVFRLPPGSVPASGGGARDDTLSSSGFEAIFDRTYGIQRVRVSGDLAVNRYRNHPDNDADYRSGAASWIWRSGNRWDGDLRWSRNEAQTSFAELPAATANTATTTERGIGINRWFHSNWSAGIRLDRVERRNSLPLLASSDALSRNVEGIVRYRPASGNTVTANYLATRADYVDAAVPGVAEGDFEQREGGVDVRFRASGASDLGLRVSRVSKRHRVASERDFTGWSGSADWAWRPTGRLSSSLAAQRAIGGAGEVLARSTVTESVSAGLVWQAAAKLSLQASLNTTTRDFLGEGPTASERTVQKGLGISYVPAIGILVSLTANEDRRFADRVALTFIARQFGASVAWSF